MSNWLNEDDDDDFLSAGFGRQNDQDSAETSNADTELSDDELAPGDGEWHPGLGFPDPSNAVRIWATEDGELSKVRVSLSWKEKLRGGSLQDAINMALMLLNGWYTLGNQMGGDITADIEPVQTDRKLSQEAVADNFRAMNEVQAKIDALGLQPNFTMTFQGASAQDFDGAVKLHLDAEGRAVRVQLDPEWLQNEANSAGISRGIMNCYRWAKAKWTPPTYEITERGKLLREQMRLQAELHAIMANGL